MARLSGINVLVTGAADALAQAVIGRLVAEGAQVIAADLPTADDGDGSFGDVVVGVDLDVTSASSWESVVATISDRFGALHGVVNLASTVRTGSLADMAAEDLQAMIDINLLGPALGIRTAAPLLAASGGGSIVNVASTEALRGARNAAVFSATNWGLRGLTRSAALELGVEGIRVNTVCPSIGLMGGPDVDPEAALADGTRQRPVTMGDVAAMVVFLLSDDSATCTGGDFLVDAGATA